MLAAVVTAPDDAGVTHLDSGASAGNRVSIVWHWRNAFQAVPDPFAGHGWDARHR